MTRKEIEEKISDLERIKFINEMADYPNYSWELSQKCDDEIRILKGELKNGISRISKW